MTDLVRLALGTLLPAFEGHAPPTWIRNALSDGLAGVTLYGQNIASGEQVRALTDELREYGEPLVCLDEEGGDVTRIGYHTGSRYPGNAALGAVDDVALTRAAHHAMGAELARLGINLDLAPSGDVNTADENPVIGTRSFGTDPTLVARHTAAAVRGLQDAGVAACVKHFPGHGATRQDSHEELPTVDADLDVLRKRELVPFRAAIGAGCATLMTAHVRVPALTGDLPATLSPRALGDLVRRELRFDGVVITDALDMKAITDTVGLARGAVESLRAGSDLLCLGPLPGEPDVLAIVEAIIGAVRCGDLSSSQLEKSVARTARLRRWLASGHAARGGSPPGPEVGLDVARRAVHVTGALPPADGPTRVVQVETPPTLAVGEVPWGLSVLPELAAGAADRADLFVRIDPSTPTADADLAETASGGRLVIVIRDAHRNPAGRDVVQRLLRLRPDAILVEMGLPIWRPDTGSYLATYGAAAVNARAAAEHLGLLSP